MKILLVAEKDSTRESLLHHLRPRGFDLIHYRHPIKAMDNIDEIEPEVVFFSAEDFPRHWKPFIKLFRETLSKERSTFVLLKGDIFSFEEAAKAKHLEVSGIIRENLADRKEYSRLEELLSRYSSLKEVRSELRYIPVDYDNIEFILTHPQSRGIVTGTLFDLSATGAAFNPDNPELTESIPIGTTIQHCSLKINETYLTFASKIVRNSDTIGLKFVALEDQQIAAISGFIDKKAERELQNVLHADSNENQASI
ncbi:MAG: PilZ domain-containing protein [Spirochaetales bacterium]|jgi:hypothetical protein|nr:PilZ domain-containing protein [Spirochaetales bacterium]